MSETPEERLADMAEFMSMDGSALVAESVAKEHAADLRWSLSELSRLREENAAYRNSYSVHVGEGGRRSWSVDVAKLAVAHDLGALTND